MKLNVFKRFIIKFASAFYPIKIYNKENLPEGNCVIVSNHFSVVDCLYLVRLNISQNYAIIAKKEALENPIANSVLRGYGAIPIDRENPEFRTLVDIIKFLKSDNNKLIVFPEGTRNKTGTDVIQPLKEGATIFALKAKCPIVPVVIGKKSKFFCKNKLIVGTPIDLSEYYGKKHSEEELKEINEMIYSKMVETQKKLKSITKI